MSEKFDDENWNIIEARCPQCGEKRQFKADFLNREVECLTCGYTMGWDDDKELKEIAKGVKND